eukprot:TRINITY_DN102569_c0_g1_i1.p1 TRINITY_DN102569_c0_g1~~TRINITY_DN102569_c0_g1_i1.p1  ORF type:complete len:120 (-),score=25.67 TRINITY_DN102569_c0_g1_i1:251-583(-)
MASTKEIFRQLSREFRLIYKTDKLQDVPIYAYMENQFRRFQVTGEKECRGQNEAHHQAGSYLCLLRSTRQLEDLRTHFHGKGERSVEESARMVGLNLPLTHKDLPPSPQK